MSAQTRRGGPAVFDDGAAVTPHDTNPISPVPSTGLWVGGAGNLKVRFLRSQNDATLNSVAAGTLLYLEVDRVYSTGTTATNIVALYSKLT